jgi:HlyD family secretion protein
MAASLRLLREAAVKRLLPWLVVLALLGVAAWQIDKWKKQPSEVAFTRVARENITSSVPTNGKIEPVEWAPARAERAGAVEEILIQRGQHVLRDAELVRLDSAEARADRASAQSRIDQIRIELDTINKGGKASDLVQISSELEKARQDLAAAQKEYETQKRLRDKQAATGADVNAAQQRVESFNLQIKSLQDRKAALVAPADRTSAEARLREAEATLHLAEEHIKQSVVRAPIEGDIYQFDLKPGAYLNAGDVVASVGRLDRVRVTVYVDERDLGRVQKKMPVKITWDALPKRTWKGSVDRTPTQIVPLGTRQVGEVVCLIENPDRDLLPGTNVNAEIRSESVDNALTIPKESVRRELGQAGVYVLEGDRLVWRNVTLGVNNVTRTQVDGLKEGDAVALLTDTPLKDGMVVKAVFP